MSPSTYLMTLFALNFFDLLPSWKDLFFFPPVRLFLAPAPPLRMKNDIVSSRKHRWKVKDDKVFATRVHNRSKNIKHSFEINVCRGFLLHEFQSFYVQFWASLVKKIANIYGCLVYIVETPMKIISTNNINEAQIYPTSGSLNVFFLVQK